MKPDQADPRDTASRPLPGGGHAARFEILRALGHGAMGVVYHARDRASGLDVALKTLLSAEPAAIYQLKHEFRVLAGIHHRNLVQLYELVVDDQDCFFTMEYLDGPSFRLAVGGTTDDLKWRAPDERRLRDAARQLCSGLSVLHARGKLHRDVKPSNVLTDRNGRVVLVDFGLATDLQSRLSQLSRDGTVAGTIAYMAPEQLWGREVTPAADMYSVGVMLYECLAGRLPIDAAQPRALVRSLEFRPCPPSSVAPYVARDLDQLVMSLLEPTPSRRPTATDVLEALRDEMPHAPVTAAARPAAPAASPFVGRGGELRELAGAFTASGRGRVAMVRVHGLSGMGKTALLERFVSDLESTHAVLVLRARCHPQETVPFKTLDGLIDQLSRHLKRLPSGHREALLPRHMSALVRLFPVLGQLPAGELAAPAAMAVEEPHVVRRRAELALRDLLGRLADRQPLCLWVDDVQWGDVDSALLVRAVLRPPDAPAVLVLLSYRSEDRRSNALLQALEAEEFGGDGAVRDLEVGPLSTDDGEALARALLGEAGIGSGRVIEALTADTQGSPFFITQFAQTLIAMHEGALRDIEPLRVEQLVRQRLGQLAAGERRLLAVVAVSNGALARRSAMRAAQLAGEGPGILSKLVQERLLRLTGSEDAVELYHDRIREAVLAQLAPPDRREYHRVLAEILDDEVASSPEVLAYHWHGAGVLDRAARHAAAAGDQAAEALRFAAAAELYGLAMEWQPQALAEARELGLKRARCLMNTGRCADAAPLFLAATALASREEALELRRLAAEQLLVSGRIDEGTAILTPLLAELGLRYPRTPVGALVGTVGRLLELGLRGRLRPGPSRSADAARRLRNDLCYSAARGLIHVDGPRGGYLSLRALLLALDVGDPVAVGRSLAMVGSSLLVPFGGALTRWGTRLVAQARRLATETDSPYLEGTVSISEGGIALIHGDWRAAAAHSERALALLRASCVGVNWECNIARVVQLRALEELGRWRECRAVAAEFGDEARRLGDRYATVVASQYACHAALAAGTIEPERGHLREALAEWSQQTFQMQHFYALRVEVFADLYEEAADLAWQRLTAAWPALQRSRLLHFSMVGLDAYHLRARAALALAAVDEHRRADLTAVCRRDQRRIVTLRLPVAGAYASTLEAGLAALAGDRDRALRALDAGIAGYEVAGMSVYRHCAERAKAQLIGGDDGAARASRADDALHQHGVTDPRRWMQLYVPGL